MEDSKTSADTSQSYSKSDFDYYFKNMTPKEIRNTVNNFKNEIAENARLFRHKLLAQTSSGSNSKSFIFNSQTQFTQIAENLKKYLGKVSELKQSIMAKEPERRRTSEEESCKEATESSYSECARDDGLDTDFTTVSEYISIREGQSCENIERMVQIEEMIIERFKFQFRSLVKMRSELRQSHNLEEVAAEISEFKISERLTFMFVVIYLFKDCIAELFDRVGINFPHLASIISTDSEGLTRDLEVYEVFKQIVIMMEQDLNKLFIESENRLNELQTQNQDAKNVRDILCCCISYSLSMKFILPKYKTNIQTDLKIRSLKDLSIGPLMYLQERYPLLMKLFNSYPEISYSDKIAFIDETEVSKGFSLDAQSCSLPSIIHGIRDLIFLRTIYIEEEVKQGLEIIGSDLIIDQLKKALRNNSNIDSCILAYSKMETNEVELIIHSSQSQSQRVAKANTTKASKLKARQIKDVREDISNLYDKYEQLYEKELQKMQQKDSISDQVSQTWTALNEFEESISKTMRKVEDASDERLSVFLNSLKERVYAVISEEFNLLIQGLSTYFDPESNSNINLIIKYPRSCYEVLCKIKNTVLNRQSECEDKEVTNNSQISKLICSDLLNSILKECKLNIENSENEIYRSVESKLELMQSNQSNCSLASASKSKINYTSRRARKHILEFCIQDWKVCNMG